MLIIIIRIKIMMIMMILMNIVIPRHNSDSKNEQALQATGFVL